MRLVRVSIAAIRITLQCIKCHRYLPEDQMMANLLGKPYQAYYCPQCIQWARDID